MLVKYNQILIIQIVYLKIKINITYIYWNICNIKWENTIEHGMWK